VLVRQVSHIEFVKVEAKMRGWKVQVKPGAWAEAQEMSMEVRKMSMEVCEMPMRHVSWSKAAAALLR
jgi:hypothetical protein